MLWLRLIFGSPPNFCRTLSLLWDLNLTHSPIIKHSRRSFWKQKTAQRNQRYALQSNLMWNHNRSCRTRTFTGIVFLWAPAFLLLSPLSFSCPLVSLRLKSLSLSLSATWLPLLYHTHMPKHGSAKTLQHFPIPALNELYSSSTFSRERITSTHFISLLSAPSPTCYDDKEGPT